LLCVADLLGYLNQFGSQHEAVGEGVGSEDGGCAAVQRLDEGVGVAGLAGELNRVSTDRVAAFAGGLVPQRAA